MNKYKSILINEELHKQLKMYAVSHGSSIVTLTENAIGNLISQKAAMTPIQLEKHHTPIGSPTTLQATPTIDRKSDIPFD